MRGGRRRSGATERLIEQRLSRFCKPSDRHKMPALSVGKTDDRETNDIKTVGWFVGGNSKTSGINDRGAFLQSGFRTIWNQTGVHLGDRIMPIGCQT